MFKVSINKFNKIRNKIFLFLISKDLKQTFLNINDMHYNEKILIETELKNKKIVMIKREKKVIKKLKKYSPKKPFELKTKKFSIKIYRRTGE